MFDAPAGLETFERPDVAGEAGASGEETSTLSPQPALRDDFDLNNNFMIPSDFEQTAETSHDSFATAHEGNRSDDQPTNAQIQPAQGRPSSDQEDAQDLISASQQ